MAREDRVTLSHDADGRPIADVEISVDIGYLDDQYQWLLGLAVTHKTVTEDKALGIPGITPDGLEGLLNFLESIRELISDGYIELEDEELLDDE